MGYLDNQSIVFLGGYCWVKSARIVAVPACPRFCGANDVMPVLASVCFYLFFDIGSLHVFVYARRHSALFGHDSMRFFLVRTP